MAGHSADGEGGLSIAGVGWLVAAGNEFGDEGIVALAPALGKLVALTSLNLSCTWLRMRLQSWAVCGGGREWSTVVQ